MQFCSVCQKNPATIVLMDLNGGSVSSQQHLCSPCAEKLGVVQPKSGPLKMSPELLEDLLGTVQGKSARSRRDPACPGCGLTMQSWKNTGRLGCPRCYESFRADLVPLLRRVHESSQHRGRLPGAVPVAAAAPIHDLKDLRKRLDDAVRGERYEEAARLRDELRQAEKGTGSPES
ncbi:MAG: UvrB/UvrC motif-containing protein [Planctomycetota bacterium]